MQFRRVLLGVSNRNRIKIDTIRKRLSATNTINKATWSYIDEKTEIGRAQQHQLPLHGLCPTKALDIHCQDGKASSIKDLIWTRKLQTAEMCTADIPGWRRTTWHRVKGQHVLQSQVSMKQTDFDQELKPNKGLPNLCHSFQPALPIKILVWPNSTHLDSVNHSSTLTPKEPARGSVVTFCDACWTKYNWWRMTISSVGMHSNQFQDSSKLGGG